MPPGVGIFILLAKLSLFLTVPAALTLVWAAWRVWRTRRAPGPLDERAAFALCWLGGLLIPFGALPIVVGTHYMLPLAPATALIAAWGLIQAADALARRWAPRLALQFRRWASARSARPAIAPDAVARALGWATSERRPQSARLGIASALTAIIAITLIVPPAYGLATVNQAEGYTAEWLQSENGSLQVAYPAYADAVNWVIAHSSGRTTVTLISTPGSLDFWKHVRQSDFPDRIRFAFGTPTDFPHSEYIIWPEHLVQRRFPTPANFDSLIAARIQGGATTYCYILRWPDPTR